MKASFVARRGMYCTGACASDACLPWKGAPLKTTGWRREKDRRRVNWFDTVFEVIDLRSFSNLWFWIAVAVMWSSASHWVLGVPYDMIMRARRQGGDVMQDLQLLVGVNVRRLGYIRQTAGLWLVGITAFMLSGLGILGFFYRVEFAQAVLLLFAPMSVVVGLSLFAARRIELAQVEGIDLCRALIRHRFAVQGIGVIAIFVTAMWGMWQNINASAL